MYRSFQEKVETYLDTIMAPAKAAVPNEATPFRGVAVKAAAQNSLLQFPDTMSARYHMNDVSGLLREKKAAIIGLGGTGSYILDFVARTHLARDRPCLTTTRFTFTRYSPAGIYSARSGRT